ncbi:MAG: ABC transporter permease [Pseudomonadota bacterium]
MLKLLSVELLKVKRSQALWMMFAIPLVVLLLNLLMMLKRTAVGALGDTHWARFWMGNTMLWCYFMMPLYIALITSLLNGHEHKNQTWRLMLTLPVSPRQLYVAKAVLAWLFVAGANAVLVGATALAIALLGVAGASQTGAFVFPMLAFWGKVSLACVPVLMIQHAVSWRVRNLVLPLAVGVMATMGITQIGSSEHWVWYPWSYALMAVSGSDPAMRSQALLIAAGVGAVLFALSAFLLGTRETQT